VDGARDELLSRSRLAGHEDGGPGGSDAPDPLANALRFDGESQETDRADRQDRGVSES
jgi:hypothetical protein